MCLAVLCNIVCCILVALQVGGSRSDMFFPMDWITVNTILINHCQSMRKTIRVSNRPKTSHIPGQSQFEHIGTIDHN
ncbi:hypothetical protein BDF19DRAFT_450778 [Syncephalis fuscata]|nr:hypothetical protein BDF19DRAFT_450747 [Syncephalis fuscata]KAI9592743.1 hypothetical protein BDF19DRAFT_450778 [Syncephalis fuscata]